jgi:hypothetical protein
VFFFFSFPYVHGVWQWPLSRFSRRYSTLPFASAVPATTLIHDQACIRHCACLMSRLMLAHLPRFYPGSTVRLLATSSMQCSTLTRRAFLPWLLSLSLVAYARSFRRSTPLLSGPCCRPFVRTSQIRVPQSLRVRGIQLVIPSLWKHHICTTVLSL